MLPPLILCPLDMRSEGDMTYAGNAFWIGKREEIYANKYQTLEDLRDHIEEFLRALLL